MLSVLDLQLDAGKHQAVDKRQVIAYVMLGDTCVDNIVMGAHNGTFQSNKQVAAPPENVETGGAALALPHLNDDSGERGSSHWESGPERGDSDPQVHPLAHLHKKTKVPLYGLHKTGKEAPRTVQLVVKKVGVEKERFGSISFSLKRF